MSIQTIRSCSINYFTQGQSSFFMKDLQNLTYDFPLLTQNYIANCYMVLVVRKSDFKIQVNNFKIEEQDKTVVIVKPGDVINLHINAQCSGTIFCFEESYFSKRYHEHALRLFSFFQSNTIPYFSVSAEVMVQFDLMLDLMHLSYLSAHPNKDKVLRSYLNIVLCELENATGAVENAQGAIKSKTTLNNRILDFLDLVDEHFKVAKTPSFYADKLCVTPNYLNKLCKQEKGVTAGHLVRQRIHVEAKRLLQFTKYTIKEIANELQFDSASYFVTFFKKQEGVTPEEYRRNTI